MINIPINAVLAIYAKENSQGMMFTGEETLAENNAEVEQKDSRKIRYLELLNRVLTRLRASLVYILKEFHNFLYTTRLLCLSCGNIRFSSGHKAH